MRSLLALTGWLPWSGRLVALSGMTFSVTRIMFCTDALWMYPERSCLSEYTNPSRSFSNIVYGPSLIGESLVDLPKGRNLPLGKLTDIDSVSNVVLRNTFM